jgi:hypothetical protein
VGRGQGAGDVTRPIPPPPAGAPHGLAEAGLGLAGHVAGQAYREALAAIGKALAGHDFAAFVQPGEALAIARIEEDFIDVVFAAKPFLDELQQPVEPLARHRGNQHTGRIAHRLGSTLDAGFGIEQVELVPRLDCPAAPHLIDAKFVQDVVDVLRLGLGLGVADIANMQDDIAATTSGSRGTASGGRQRK